MLATLDRALLERIARSTRPGVLLRQALESTRMRRRRCSKARFQPALPITRVLQTAGQRVVHVQPAGALFPWELVQCRIGGQLQVQACLTRRAKVYPSGGEQGGIGGPKGRPVILECLGCQLGASYAARSSWFVAPKPSRAPEVLSPAQRAAKALYRAEHELDDQDWMDPMREAAMLSPDDTNV
jgi:hypothetical protein